MVVIGDMSEKGDILSINTTIFHLPFYFWDTTVCFGRQESATPEFDKRQYWAYWKFHKDLMLPVGNFIKISCFENVPCISRVNDTLPSYDSTCNS